MAEELVLSWGVDGPKDDDFRFVSGRITMSGEAWAAWRSEVDRINVQIAEQGASAADNFRAAGLNAITAMTMDAAAKVEARKAQQLFTGYIVLTTDMAEALAAKVKELNDAAAVLDFHFRDPEEVFYPGDVMMEVIATAMQPPPEEPAP